MPMHLFIQAMYKSRVVFHENMALLPIRKVYYHMPNTLDNSKYSHRKCTLSDPLPTMVIFFHITHYESYRIPPQGKQHITA